MSIKLEVNKTYIGVIENICIRQLGKAFRDEFKTDNYIRTVSDTQLYGGKFVALLARNYIKDSYDICLLLREGINFNFYKKGIIYNLLSSNKSAITILSVDINEIPKELRIQLRTLGAKNFSLEEHIETRKKSKDILAKMLNQQDLYYILASAIGVIDQTDYEFKDMIAVKKINDLNKNDLVKDPKKHERLIDDSIKEFPLTSIKTKSLYNNFKRYVERQIKTQNTIPLKIDNSTGPSR